MVRIIYSLGTVGNHPKTGCKVEDIFAWSEKQYYTDCKQTEILSAKSSEKPVNELCEIDAICAFSFVYLLKKR